MSTEAIVIPIIIDPKAGVAGLKAVGEQAAKTNGQMGGLSNSTGKFGSAMMGAAKNALAMFGAMNLAEGAVKIFVAGLIDAVTGTNKLASSSKLLHEAQVKATESTRDEVVELQTLFTVAKDTTLGYGQRQAAINALNKQYPELHKNLTLENIGNREVAESIGLVIDKMVKKAQLGNIITEIAGLTNQLDKLKTRFGENYSGSFSNLINNEMAKLQERISTLTAAAVKLQATTITSVTGVSLLGGAAGDGGLKTGPITVQPSKININTAQAGEAELTGGREGLPVLPPASARAKINRDPSFTGVADVEAIEMAIKKQQELLSMNERLASQVSGVLTPAFDALFDAITTKQDVLKAFFSAIGNSVKQLIKQLIQAAIQAAVLSLLTGGTAKGGFSFLGAFKKITGFAEGGLVTGPVSALVGEGRGTSASNPEVIAPLDKLKDFFGNMMPGNRGYAANGNMGTAGSIVSMPRQVILRMSGREMVGVIELETRSQGRTG
jgi:hypothetical protein